MNRSRVAGFALAVSALVIWSGVFVTTRLTLTHTLTIYDLTALRLGIGAVVLLPVLVRSARTIPAAAWREGVVLSACWGAPFVLLLSWGIQFSSAAHAAAITPTIMPVFAAVLGWVVLRERVRPVRWAGLGLICAGVLALTASLGTHGHAGEEWAGTAPLLAAAALWAIYTLRVRRTGLTAIQAAALVCLYSTIVYVPAYAALGLSRLSAAPWAEVLLQGFYQGVLVSGVSLAAYNGAIALIGAAAVASVVSLVPVLTIVLAVPVLDEWPTPFTATAAAVITGGAILAARMAASPPLTARSPSA